jgi:hypothetical protein
MKLILIIIILIISFSCFAQEIEKRKYSAQRIEESNLKIDGIFDETTWMTANWENNFIQNRPYEGNAPSQQTEFAILYDKNNIYVAIKALDINPDSISTRLTRRDNAEGDGVGIIFDTYNDKRTGFSFSVSAAGIKSDMVLSDDAVIQDKTWDPIWWVKTIITDNGWNAEMCIPLTQLRFKEGVEQIWGMQVNRYIFRIDESSQWQPMKKEQAGYISKFGELSGIKNIKPKNALDFTPYILSRVETFKKEPDNPFRSSGTNKGLNAGLDAKIGLTNFLTMDLTINPDFGQVEADPSRVNLSVYETFFEEKRPFFVEGKNILKYNLETGDSEWTTEGLFYSRRIGKKTGYTPYLQTGEYAELPDFVNIIGAAKVTGKTKNGWSVGILESVTAEENVEIKGNEIEKSIVIEPLTNYFVGRIQKDFNEGNTYFGSIVTAVNRKIDDPQIEYMHSNAYSGGIDLVHKWNNKKWTAEAGFFGSHVNGSKEAIARTQTSWIHNYQRPDADYLEFDPEKTSLTGHGGKLSLGKLDGKLMFGTLFSWRSPGLELNDVGFAQQIDQLKQVVWANYQVYEPVSIIRNGNLNVSEYALWDFGGNLNSLGASISGKAQFKNYWNAMFNASFSGEQLLNSELRGGPALKSPGYRNITMNVSTNPQNKLTFMVNGGTTFTAERDYGAGYNLSVNIGYRPLKTLRLDISPGMYLSNDEMQYVNQKSYESDTRYIFGHISQKTFNMSFRLNYNLTPDLTVQFWGQPFIATGEYNRYKHITDGKADIPEDRYNFYTDDQIFFNSQWNIYNIDDNRDGEIDYTFVKPDFNVKTFLSNFVVRWEYLPGSVVYLVWSQNRNHYINDGNLDFSGNIAELFKAGANNIFILKLSYRIGR